jgi:hypothetical protein
MQTFNQGQLAIVAYGQVSGVDGSSTLCNSGVVTTRTALGTYRISLPVASQNQLGLAQSSDRDIVVVTPLEPAGTSTFSVNNADPVDKFVLMGSSSTTSADVSFSFIIFRTLTPVTPGIPA